MTLPISLEKLNNKFTISRANNASGASGLMRAKPCYDLRLNNYPSPFQHHLSFH